MTRHVILGGLSPDPTLQVLLLVIRPIPDYDWHLTQDLTDGFSLNSL
jgi:hypothetical protein